MTTLDTPVAAPLAEAAARLEDDPGDSSYGWVMFVAFTAAVLAVTFAVCVLAKAPTWWMLGAAFATHLGVTTATFKVVLGAFGADTEAYPDLESTYAASRALAERAAGDKRPVVTLPAYS